MAGTLNFNKLSEISHKIITGEISSVAVTQALLDRINELDPTLKSYAQVMGDAALKDAAVADAEIAAGKIRGPLHGVPVAIKDLFDMKGSITAIGSTIYGDNENDSDSALVERLRDAGAIILGKLNMTEFALSGYHPDMDVPVNPWNHDFWAGVSSSGSGVAASAGLAYATVGTDTGGSIRFPASSNGVVGIKPTYGTVSAHGSFALAPSLDHPGTFARNVEDAALLLQAISGHDDRDPTSIDSNPEDLLSKLHDGAAGLKIGYCEKYAEAEGVHPDVVASMKAAKQTLQDAGAEIVPVDLSGLLGTGEVWGGIVAWEALANHKATWPSRKDEYGPVFGGLLEAGETLNEEIYAGMQGVVNQCRTVVAEALSGVDMLLCPASPVTTGPVSELGPQDVLPPEVVTFFVMYAAPFNYTGSPSITVPCGFDSENALPLGLQLIGAHGDEATLIQAAAAYEQKTGWHDMIPRGINEQETSNANS